MSFMRIDNRQPHWTKAQSQNNCTSGQLIHRQKLTFSIQNFVLFENVVSFYSNAAFNSILLLFTNQLVLNFWGRLHVGLTFDLIEL